MHELAKIPLAPLLIAQGRRVRAKIERLAEPEGARFGTCGSGPSLRVLVVGDSAAAGVGARSQEQALLGQLRSQLQDTFTLHYRLVARSGDTTVQAIEHLEEQAAEPFDVAVTSLGVNDVTSQISLRRWMLQQQQLAALLRDRFKVQNLIISGLPPMGRFPALPQPLRWYLGRRAIVFSSALESWARSQSDCSFLQLNLPFEPEAVATDGFHPGPPAYTQWAELVAGEIRSLRPAS